MEVSSQDPPLMAMDLSKGFSVNPLTRSHAEAMDLAKKPEWYHRRPPSCSTEIGSPFRSRASSSYGSQLHAEPGAPVHCRDMEQRPETLGNYMNSTLAPALDLYRDGVHGNLWHPGFYGPEQSGSAVPESSGAEESDSGSDVIFLVSSAKEPLLCSPFIQDSVRHIVEPLSPAVSSLDEGRGCYHLPQPLSSPSPDSSYSEDSSDSSVDIPVHHTRPVVLLSDLSAVYANAAESLVDISSDDSDVIEVSVTNEKKSSSVFPCQNKKTRETRPQSEDGKAPPTEVRRSSRIRKSVSEIPLFTCSGSRHSLRRRAKNDAVGIYNESCDSDDAMEYAVRLSSSDADESPPQPNASQRASSNSEESAADVRTDRRSPRGQPQLRRTASCTESISDKRKKPLSICKTQNLRRTKHKQNIRVPSEQHQRRDTKTANKKNVMRRRKKRRTPAGASAQFPPGEPEIKLKYVKVKEKKDKRSASFCPFVHVEERTCTVVNYQEEEATVRSRGAGPQQTPAVTLPGFVPNTSCFQLGRFSSESQCQSTLLCCLCGQTANAVGLGDLHGPYHPTSTSAERQSQQQDGRTEQSNGERSHGLVKSHAVNSSEERRDGHDSSAVNSLLQSNDAPVPKVPVHLDECWIHEDCGIWSAGVFLVRGKLYGLAEASRLAQETVCSACSQTGAIMGCFQKGCPRNYHYRCAIQSGCVLNEDNFSIRCPEHKNRPLTCVTRQHKR